MKIGDRCADVQKANDLREQKWKRMMDECKKDPEEYSPVALIPKTSTPAELGLLKGQVIEVRYSMENCETGDKYMHCWEGTVADVRIAGKFVLAGVAVST